MTSVSLWRLFAYMDDDDSCDERRVLADWQIGDVVRWCMTRGYDHIYLSRDPSETTRWERIADPEEIRHTSNIVALRSPSGDQEDPTRGSAA